MELEDDVGEALWGEVVGIDRRVGMYVIPTDVRCRLLLLPLVVV